MKGLIFILLLCLAVLTSIRVQAQDLSNLKEKQKFRISGQLSAGGTYSESTSQLNVQSPYSYMLGASLHVQLWGISIPFYASFNNQKSAFNHPFNRYGLSPKYKWARAHIGWRSMSFSQFTMNNISFLGGGLELNPGRFRFAAMYGHLQQAVELQNAEFGIPRFKRRAAAMKIGFGTEMRHLDLLILKAKDDIHSLDVSDSLAQLMPAHENLALGIKNKLSFLKNRLVFDLDVAGSIFAHDIRHDTLEVEELQSRKWTRHVFTPTISTSATYAGEARLHYRHKNFGISTQYRRVMPDYKSLGAEYILSDLEAITINPSLTLLKGKVTVSASIGLQRDNLDGKRLSSNQRSINSVNMQLIPSPKWSAMLSYSNFTFEQQVHLDSLYNDSILINQLNHQMSFAPRYKLDKKRIRHTWMLTLTHQILDDRNKLKAMQQSNDMTLGNLVYDLHLKKQDIHLHTAVNLFQLTTSEAQLNRYGASAGFRMKLLENKMNLRANVAFNRQEQLSERHDYILNTLGISYLLFKKTSLGVQGSYDLSIRKSDTDKSLYTRVFFSQRF